MSKNQQMLNPNKLFDQIQEAVQFIRSSGYVEQADVALIFGSGLGEISKGLIIDHEIPYLEIPGFVTTTVDFHKGRLLFGTIGQQNVVAMDGRFHYYEGYTMQEVTFPVRVMHGLGAKTLMLSNISGGVNPEFRAGDIVVLSDHINLMGDSPLIGPNDERLGPRYPDMMEPYSRRLIAIAERCAMAQGLNLKRAVYLALSGPTFETRAEYRMLRNLGGDLIGMSSIPECIVAKHSGMEVLGFSLVSDECFPECLEPIDLDVLLERAAHGSKVIFNLFEAIMTDSKFINN